MPLKPKIRSKSKFRPNIYPEWHHIQFNLKNSIKTNLNQDILEGLV